MPELLSGQALAERADLVLQVPLVATLGLELLDAADPPAGAVLTLGELAGNGAGGAHAAVLAAGLEMSALLALLPFLGSSEHAITHMSTLTLVAAATTGARVEFRGSVDRRTGRLGFVGAVATVDDQVVARATITKSVVAFSR